MWKLRIRKLEIVLIIRLTSTLLHMYVGFPALLLLLPSACLLALFQFVYQGYLICRLSAFYAAFGTK